MYNTGNTIVIHHTRLYWQQMCRQYVYILCRYSMTAPGAFPCLKIQSRHVQDFYSNNTQACLRTRAAMSMTVLVMLVHHENRMPLSREENKTSWQIPEQFLASCFEKR